MIRFLVMTFLASFCIGTSAWADGVIFATQEDVQAFDALIQKSQSGQAAEATAKARERTKEIQDKVRSALENAPNLPSQAQQAQGASGGGGKSGTSTLSTDNKGGGKALGAGKNKRPTDPGSQGRGQGRNR